MRVRRKRDTGATVAPVGGLGPLAGVTRYVLERPVLERSLELIGAAGDDGDELFVAWGGNVVGEVARIRAVFVPRQRCLHTTEGMYVHIDGDALFELSKGLYEQGLALIGQAHAHPSGAFHSRADDDLAFVTTPGGISAVIPDFARGPGPDRRWRWFRRDPEQRWLRLDPRAVTLE
jgi:hypothetical protein